MSEHVILYVAGGVLATITAVRFILQELTTVVLLYKKLKAIIKADLPFEPPPRLDQTDSKHQLKSGEL